METNRNSPKPSRLLGRVSSRSHGCLANCVSAASVRSLSVRVRSGSERGSPNRVSSGRTVSPDGFELISEWPALAAGLCTGTHGCQPGTRCSGMGSGLRPPGGVGRTLDTDCFPDQQALSPFARHLLHIEARRARDDLPGSVARPHGNDSRCSTDCPALRGALIASTLSALSRDRVVVPTPPTLARGGHRHTREQWHR